MTTPSDDPGGSAQPPTPGRHADTGGPNQVGASSIISREILANMSTSLKSQAATNEALRQTINQMRFAVTGLTSVMDSMINPIGPGNYGPNVGPNGGRPIMPQHQSRPGMNTPAGNNPNYGRGLGGVRRHIATGLQRRYGTPGNTYEPLYEDPANPNNQTGWRVRDHAAGRIFRTDVGSISPEEADAANAAAQGAATRGGILGAFGEAGLVGGIRAVPYLGAAVMGAEAVHEAVAFAGNQRAANAQYQSIYGGTNFAQFGQRTQQYGFQLGQLFGGGLTWDQSQQAFQGISSLGYQGAQRSNDLNFVVQNYKNLGVSVSDSLKLITEASQNLNESLTGLRTGLENTRNAAIATGQSGTVGTQMFRTGYACALYQNRTCGSSERQRFRYQQLD
jgi:hypothetical protein